MQYYIFQMFGISKICYVYESLLSSQMVHFLDKIYIKNSYIVKYYYSLKMFYIFIYFKM